LPAAALAGQGQIRGGTSSDLILRASVASVAKDGVGKIWGLPEMSN
jgi:hypothetical protein